VAAQNDSMNPRTTVFDVFACCVDAIQSGQMIHRESAGDKEFHFQNWFRKRLREAGRAGEFNHEQGGRNTYPDFTIVETTEGFELKGLAYPGRDATFDSNSQVPTGFHNGRTIYYVFGRYPKRPDGNDYPVLDLVVCHGDFLNLDHEYVHKNRSVQGFGSYGDILIRDRKMYVVPTPFHLIEGVAHYRTLVLPADVAAPQGFFEVGTLARVEATELLVTYSFDLRTTELHAQRVRNPSAGKEHLFRAWRRKGEPPERVSMRAVTPHDLEH